MTVSVMRNSLEASTCNLGILLDARGSLPVKVGSECSVLNMGLVYTLYY